MYLIFMGELYLWAIWWSVSMLCTNDLLFIRNSFCKIY